MFSNEVLIDKTDKDRLTELLNEASKILDKYPYEIYDGSHTVTTMSRAKSSLKETKQWCRLLYITKGEPQHDDTATAQK